MRRRLLAAILSMLMTPSLAIAQEPDCPQFFINGQPPVLTNPDNRQRTMLLCNDAYASLASGLTHGPVWSAEHPAAAPLEAARQIRRENEFHREDRLLSDDQAQLSDYRHSGFDRGHMTPSGDMPDARAGAELLAGQRGATGRATEPCRLGGGGERRAAPGRTGGRTLCRDRPGIRG